MTGRYPWQLGAAANHQCIFPPEYGIFPEALTAGGYFYATTGKTWGPGSMLDAQGKPRAYAGKAYNQAKATPPATGITNNDYAGNFEAFLRATRPEQPWFFWAGPIEPHRDYEYGTGVRLGGKKPSDIDRVPATWPDNETVRNDLLDYAFEVEHADRHRTVAMAAGLFVGHHRGTDFVRVKVVSGLVQQAVGGRFQDARNEALAHQVALAVAAVGVEAVANDGATLTHHVGHHRHQAEVHFGKVDVGVANIALDRAGRFADFGDFQNNPL
jgi:hypothetical protein